MGYQTIVVKGFSWITGLRVVTRLLTFVRLAILGRILTPAEFGFFGVASLLLALLEILTETGINVFLIQYKGQIKEYINSAFIVSIGRGILLSLLIVLAAPFIAMFFHASAAYPVIVAIAIVPFIRGFINPAIIVYQKELLFANEFKFRTALFVTDVCFSIAAGLLTRSAASFVWGLAASAVLEVILSYILIPLRPKMTFEIEKVKHVIQRGGWVTLTGIFSYFADNGDNLTVGKILGSSALGIYQVAYKFSTLPISEITNVINQVIFPVYSKFSDDMQRLKKAFIKVTIISSVTALLLGGTIFLFAGFIIPFVMGDQWDMAIAVIKILAIYGILRTFFGSFSALFLSLGKQEFVAKMTFVRSVGLFIVIIPFVMHFGMIGAGYAMLFSILIEIPVIIYLTRLIFLKKIKTNK